MVSIEPWALNEGEEELRAICVWSRVCHAKQTALIMLQLEVFVGEVPTVDRHASCAITLRDVASLRHEVLDDSMQHIALVGELLSIVACTQGPEVLSSLGTMV